MDFRKLVYAIQETHRSFQRRTVKVINQNLVIRNWLFGFFIVEFEQNGKDYASHGDRLLYKLSDELKQIGLAGVSYTSLTLFRKFYLAYPQFRLLAKDISEIDSASLNLQTLSEDLEWYTPPEKLLNNLSFSHFIELIKVESPVQRAFYETESIKGNWSVRQLQRQIGSSLYERTGLSINKEALLSQLKEEVSLPTPAEIIRDPYVFEFLGLKMKEVFLEKDLEKALLDHLQEFLLELGTGFCFEARQKSFLIDNRRYSVDLLFYHRLLKCHILIDLKTGEFTHEDAGQMNFYLDYFKDNEMHKGDNPPIGIIFCSLKHAAVVKYATGGLDNQVFISRYLLKLPSEEVLKQFLLDEKKRLE